MGRLQSPAPTSRNRFIIQQHSVAQVLAVDPCVALADHFAVDVAPVVQRDPPNESTEAVDIDDFDGTPPPTRFTPRQCSFAQYQ
jgi:hypothetical protein